MVPEMLSLLCVTKYNEFTFPKLDKHLFHVRILDLQVQIVSRHHSHKANNADYVALKMKLKYLQFPDYNLYLL